MGNVTYRDGIAILQIVVFVPASLFALALNKRHGFSAAWWLILIFTLARLVGAVAQLVTTHNPGVGAEVTVLTTLYLGISPLVQLSWAMLLRLNDQIGKPMPIWIYHVLILINLTALVLGIYGAYMVTSDTLETGMNFGNGFAESALIIFAVMFALSILFVIPLLTLRIVYKLISDFAQYKNFNVFNVSSTLYLSGCPRGNSHHLHLSPHWLQINSLLDDIGPKGFGGFHQSRRLPGCGSSSFGEQPRDGDSARCADTPMLDQHEQGYAG